MPVHLIIRENNQDKRVKLTSRPLVLGRSSKTHIQIQDQMCSGKHCAFKLSEQFKVLVKDLESTNGTYLNDCQIMDSHLMLDDVIKIGSCEIFIDHAGLSPKEKAILTRDEPTAQIKFVDLPSNKNTLRPSQVVRAKQQAAREEKNSQKPKSQSPKKFFPDSNEAKPPVINKPTAAPEKEPAKKTEETSTKSSLKDRIAARGKKISQEKTTNEGKVSNERQIDLEESSGDTQFIKLDDSTNSGKKKDKVSFASKIKKAFKK